MVSKLPYSTSSLKIWRLCENDNDRWLKITIRRIQSTCLYLSNHCRKHDKSTCESMVEAVRTCATQLLLFPRWQRHNHFQDRPLTMDGANLLSAQLTLNAVTKIIETLIRTLQAIAADKSLLHLQPWTPGNDAQSTCTQTIFLQKSTIDEKCNTFAIVCRVKKCLRIVVIQKWNLYYWWKLRTVRLAVLSVLITPWNYGYVFLDPLGDFYILFQGYSL